MSIRKLALFICLNLSAVSLVVAEETSDEKKTKDTQSAQKEWVQSPNFPPPPGFNGNTNYTTNNYPDPNGRYYQYNAQSQQPQAAGQNPGQNGVAKLPPLVPPNGYDRAKSHMAPFTPEQLKELRNLLESTRKANSYEPVRSVPRISGESVDLSPGAAIPILRTLPGEMSSLVFIDSTGAPWPLAAAPRVSGGNNKLFSVEWLKDSPTVIVSALTSYQDGNLTVLLKGLATPVVIKLVTGEADNNKKLRVVDFRKDLRIPGRGPFAKAPIYSESKINLYNDTLQSFLDGIKPANAKPVKWQPKDQYPSEKVQIWQLKDKLFLRTRLSLQSGFDETLASSDGTKVYSMPLTPYINLSDMSNSIVLLLNIEQ
ncbi:hypothetical protein KCM76_22295 [Zooshikella marina]|uniref:DotH/IcmK family type IV secretion protein n=1 Tax=Zooshikella ganghwensis TaxID=202772 RepID=UPI001BAF946D|nr:DotH/IcmK family type IV secretion protein [Zooshikella ganghwensis]MBU2708740.1 hypothetical protein [Zooshikella ganghwensis]